MQFGVPVSVDEAESLAVSVSDWPAFPDWTFTSLAGFADAVDAEHA